MRHLAGFAGLAVLAGIAGTGAQRAPVPSGLEPQWFDRSVRPQDDLYRYSNGGWIDRTPMPDERVTYTASTELVEKVEADLREIIEALSRSADRRPGSTSQQIVDLYASVQDEARLEALGASPLAPELRAIDAIATPRDLATRAGAMSASSTAGPFFATVAADPRDPAGRVVHLSQGGILLPDAEYYSSNAPQFVRARREYVAYLGRIFTLVGRGRAGEDAAAVLALETSLARAFRTPQSGAPASPARLVTLSQLASEMPAFDWRAWAGPQGIDRARAIVLTQPSFFSEFAALVPRVPLDTWKAWLAARYITAMSPYVSETISDARFDFFGTVLTGQQIPRPRWRRGVSLVNGFLGDAIGRLYVEQHFPSSSRTRVRRIVDNLVREYRQALREAEWMTSSARAEADAKLVRMRSKIGYPDAWREYRGLEISADDLFGNLLRGQRFDNRARMARLERPVDPGEWLMTPQTVNAYYAPATNEIVFPAAILQPPYFDPEADEAVNYGAIGAVIGHEIWHALDDRGRYYDAEGRSRDWWTPRDEAGYRALAQRLADHYAGYRSADGVPVNGGLTAAENLGDLAGLSIAYRAYARVLAGRPAPVIDGVTGDQRFFLGWARVWRAKDRPEYLRQILYTSPYAPAPFRANGPVGHLQAFHDAFGVKPGDGMFLPPAARLRVF